MRAPNCNVLDDELAEMDQISPEFPETDVALVLGAIDVVNPDARTAQDSPVYGMPILNVDQARQVMVIQRSPNPGFAGIDNPLFYPSNTIDGLRRRQGDRRGLRAC